MSTEQLVNEINKGSRANMAAILNAVIADASTYRPFQFDAICNRTRAHYENRAESLIMARLGKMYPSDASRMVPWSYGFIGLDASVRASVYDLPQRRWLADADGVADDMDSPESKEFALSVKFSGWDNAMAECERRAQTPVKCHVVAFRHREMVVDGEKRMMVSVELFWPEDVHVLPSANNPSEIQLAHAVAVRINGPMSEAGKASQWFELWTRAEDGWYVSQVSQDGESNASATGVKYHGKYLPFMVYRTRPAAVGPWPAVGSDELDIAEGLNAGISDKHYVLGYQGHDSVVYKGVSDKPTLKFGPGSFNKVLPGEELSTLAMNPHSADHSASIVDGVRLWAIVNRQSPSSYSFSDSPTVESGVARLVANEPQEKQRTEQIGSSEVFETTSGYVFRDVHDKFCAGVDVGTGDARPVFAPLLVKNQPKPRPVYEDPESKQRREVELFELGQLSPAELMVSLGRFKSVAEAEGDGYSNVRTAATDFTSAVPAFESRNATKQAPDTEKAETPAVEPAAAPVDVVADTALNGAQVTALVTITQQVALGTLPKSAAEAIIAAAFPTLSPEKVRAIISPLVLGSAAEAQV